MAGQHLYVVLRRNKNSGDNFSLSVGHFYPYPVNIQDLICPVVITLTYTAIPEIETAEHVPIYILITAMFQNHVHQMNSYLYAYTTSAYIPSCLSLLCLHNCNLMFRNL